MTDSFGTRLRRQRERQRITLAQIAASTKIKASLFEGLERDDVSKWPSGIFRRSFVRSYAQAIGLNPDEVCQEFLERFPDGTDSRPAAAGGPGTATGSPAVTMSPSPASLPSVAASAPGNTADLRAEDESPLRLTLADQGLARRRVLVPASPGLRWRTVALDLGLVLVVAISAFVILDRFWAPLAVTSLAYYLLTTLALGYTPGMLVFGSPDAAAPGAEIPSAAGSLERALARRIELSSEPFRAPAAARPPVTDSVMDDLPELRMVQPEAGDPDPEEDAAEGERPRSRRMSYPPLPPPVDISSRRIARS